MGTTMSKVYTDEGVLVVEAPNSTVSFYPSVVTGPQTHVMEVGDDRGRAIALHVDLNSLHEELGRYLGGSDERR